MTPPAKRTKTTHTSESSLQSDYEDANISPEKSTVLTPFDAAKTYRLIEPGPVVLVSTSLDGKDNLMTMGFHMPVQHEDPPLLSCIIGPWDHSFNALQETGECVIAIPGVDIAERVVDIGNCSGEDVDKFEKFELTKAKGEKVNAPLVEDCLACIECKVHDTKMVKKYNMWILRPVQAWVNMTREEKRVMHHRGDGTFVFDGEVLNLQERMTKWKEYQD